MEDVFYSVEDLSRILDMHPKTVRRFLREGILKGRKIGREWKVRQQDLAEFTHGELKESPIPSNAHTGPRIPAKVNVSAVIEVIGKDSDEASRISNSLMALLNTKGPGWGETRFDFIYHPEEAKARYILFGPPAFISEIMKVFQIIQTKKDE